MRVLHVPFTYFPDPVGGTEVYVRQLARALVRHGIESEVAAPCDGEDAKYEIDGVPVYRYAVGGAGTVEEIYGDGSAEAATAFARVLRQSRPDVVHLHAFTRGVSLGVARVALDAGCRLIYTYHTVTASCLRGDLLLHGVNVCDGEMIVARCVSCVLGDLGLPTPGRQLLARVGPSASRSMGSVLPRGPAATAIRMPELVALRHGSFRRLVEGAERVVAVSAWVRALLLRNGVPEGKLVLSRHGTTAAPLPRRGRTGPALPLRLAMLGRLDPSKGIHILLEALRADPGLPVHIDVYAVQQAGTGAYEARIRAMVAAEPRVRLLPPVPSDDVVPMLAEYDLVAVPSEGMETGPLTVLEAFAAGIPAIGSRLGGIAELVRDGVDGLLVPRRSPAAWLAALRRLVHEPDLLPALCAGISVPRSMDLVGADMAAVYLADGSIDVAAAAPFAEQAPR